MKILLRELCMTMGLVFRWLLPGFILILGSSPHCSISVPFSKPQAECHTNKSSHNNKQRTRCYFCLFLFLGHCTKFFPVVPHCRADMTLQGKHCFKSFVKTIAMKIFQKNKSSPLLKWQGCKWLIALCKTHFEGEQSGLLEVVPAKVKGLKLDDL